MQNSSLAQFLADNRALPAVSSLTHNWAKKNGGSEDILKFGSEYVLRADPGQRWVMGSQRHLAIMLKYGFGFLSIIFTLGGVLMYLFPHGSEKYDGSFSKFPIYLFLTLGLIFLVISALAWCGQKQYENDMRSSREWLEHHADDIQKFETLVSDLQHIMQTHGWGIDDLKSTFGSLRVKNHEKLRDLGAQVVALRSDPGLKLSADRTLSLIHI